MAALAAGLAFASVSLTAYWTLGGTALLDTVGDYAEEFARTGGTLAVMVALLGSPRRLGSRARAGPSASSKARRRLIAIGPSSLI
jgi:hypothetical protein